ncbi:hypothetical protein D3C80_1599580 [compost metagenome]
MQQRDHGRTGIGLDELELQPRAQADLLQDVGGYAANLLLVIVETQRRKVFVHQHTGNRVLFDPAPLLVAQGQGAAIKQHAGAAAAPAAQDVQAFGFTGDAQ